MGEITYTPELGRKARFSQVFFILDRGQEGRRQEGRRQEGRRQEGMGWRAGGRRQEAGGSEAGGKKKRATYGSVTRLDNPRF